MPVYFFTFHAYRSWRPDHPRGYTKRNVGVLPPDPATAATYDSNATHAPVLFTRQMQEVMITGAHDICTQRSWDLHAMGFENNHIHLLVSWRDFIYWLEVRSKLKNLLSLFLSRLAGIQSRPWFSDGASRKRVCDQAHFNYLIQTYIPKHTQLIWFEGDPLPLIPDHILTPKKMNP